MCVVKFIALPLSLSRSFSRICMANSVEESTQRIFAKRWESQQSRAMAHPPHSALPKPAWPHNYRDKRRRRLAYSCKFDLDTISFHNRKANKWGGGDVKQLGEEGNTRTQTACVRDNGDNNTIQRVRQTERQRVWNTRVITQLSSAWVKSAALSPAASQLLTPAATCQNLTLCTQHISYRIALYRK